MSQAAGGVTIRTKSVSCQLTVKRVMKQMMMAERQPHHFVIHIHADVAHYSGAERHHDVGGSPVADALQAGHEDQDAAHQTEREESAVRGDLLLHPGIGIIHDEVLVERAPGPFPVGIDVLVYLEEDVQYGDEHYEGEHVEPLCYEVEHDRPDDVHLVGLEVPLYYVEELLYHHSLSFCLPQGLSHSPIGRWSFPYRALVIPL